MDQMIQTGPAETVSLDPGTVREGIHTQYLMALDRAEGHLTDAVAWGEIHPQLDGTHTADMRGALDVIGKARQAVMTDTVPQFESTAR